MPESSLEKLVPEQDFLEPLEQQSSLFFQLTGALLELGQGAWRKRHYFQLHSEADELESFLDDYGARYNQTFNFLTELIASVRGFALAGMSLEHLRRRLDAYRVIDSFSAEEQLEARAAIKTSTEFVRESLTRLIQALFDEASSLGLSQPEQGFPAGGFEAVVQRSSLPRNVGQEEPEDEEQKIAEVASKFIAACAMLNERDIRSMGKTMDCVRFLETCCTEEVARVYEATVHNLQSAYDTHIGNTVLEFRDPRLNLMRGYISATLHLLEAVTQLTHFVERHERGHASVDAARRIGDIVPREEVCGVILNQLLCWASAFMVNGRKLAEELLPSYTNVQVLEVQISEDITLHARPVSLIVGIVNHYGTPVEMELAGQVCSGGSILELMIAVGSHPDVRTFTFRGDENPLRDIGLLFEHDLGEQGLSNLPDRLDYLRNN